MNETRSAAAVFLDRDGTVIEDADYPQDPTRVRPLPGAVEALRTLRAAGLRLVLVSNQSGLGRGYFSEREAEAVHTEVVRQFATRGVAFDGAYYCPHAPEAACACRKPEPGLLLQAARDLGLDLARSYMIGDRPSDVEAGRRVGAATILLAPSPAAPQAGADLGADLLASDWDTVVRYIRRHREQHQAQAQRP
jgi:histidinol-phosphate phosphatase family protein